jgi:hypothetical protein
MGLWPAQPPPRAPISQGCSLLAERGATGRPPWLLFALTLQGPLEVAEMGPGLTQPLAYAKDTFLQGAPAST